jgi:hypothetical protein
MMIERNIKSGDSAVIFSSESPNFSLAFAEKIPYAAVKKIHGVGGAVGFGTSKYGNEYLKMKTKYGATILIKNQKNQPRGPIGRSSPR